MTVSQNSSQNNKNICNLAWSVWNLFPQHATFKVGGIMYGVGVPD